jgi:hypothetical protein
MPPGSACSRIRSGISRPCNTRRDSAEGYGRVGASAPALPSFRRCRHRAPCPLPAPTSDGDGDRNHVNGLRRLRRFRRLRLPIADARCLPIRAIRGQTAGAGPALSLADSRGRSAAHHRREAQPPPPQPISLLTHTPRSHRRRRQRPERVNGHPRIAQIPRITAPDRGRPGAVESAKSAARPSRGRRPRHCRARTVEVPQPRIIEANTAPPLSQTGPSNTHPPPDQEIRRSGSLQLQNPPTRAARTDAIPSCPRDRSRATIAGSDSLPLFSQNK